MWFLLACGYASYYPDASRLPHETGVAVACGEPTDEAVELTITAQSAAALTLYVLGTDCTEAYVTPLVQAQPWHESTRAGMLYRARRADGSLYDELEVPGGAPTYSWVIQ